MLMATPVSTAEEIEAMRTIFNECIAFMTKKFEPITPAQQSIWWRELQDKRFKAFVYRDSDNKIVAYSLLQWHEDNKISPLFGITASARGHNYAREIIRHYLTEAGEPVYGEELSSHKAMIRLNEEAGYELVREENGVRYLFHPNGKRIPPDYLALMDSE